MKTPYLLALTGSALTALAFAPAVPVLSAALGLAALGALGELWLRALVREPLTPMARLGLATVAGLVSLPIVALVLHRLSLRIDGRGLATGLDALAVLAAVASTVRGKPRPVHWVGPATQTGTTNSRRLSTMAAVGVPLLLALAIGGGATTVYQRLPHPAEPGYTSLALAGWAAGIARPVAIPAAGVVVPLEVSSAGEQPRTADLRVRIGDRPAGPAYPVAVPAGTTGLRVHVPAPADGCLHPIRISLGAASTVFYGRGPFPARTRGKAAPC